MSDARLYNLPVLSALQGDFDGDTGPSGLAGTQIIPPFNSQVRHILLLEMGVVVFVVVANWNGGCALCKIFGQSFLVCLFL